MKRFCISFLVCIIIILSVVGVVNKQNAVTTEYLRIHVRADSNEQDDQLVKYAVKDALVEYLTPIISEITTKDGAIKTLTDCLDNLTNVANKVLVKQGFDYTANVNLKREEFPTRVYQGFTLEQGFYDALIVELGSGEGDNWWCVVYPPLCFTGEGVDYKYKSKIYEIINDFIKKQREGK